MRKGKVDVYEIVTQRILSALEQGIVPWHKPWKGGVAGMPKNLVSKKTYRGCNIFMLYITAEMNGFDSPYWMTFKQAQSIGGQVKKGSKATPVIFWKFIEKETGKFNSKGEPITDGFPILRYYNVFNLNQIDGIDESKLPDDAKPVDGDMLDFEPIEICDNIVDGMPNKPEMTCDEARAYYRPATDTVNIPKQGLFNSEEEYYSTLFHELVHSTKHESRLNRKSDGDKAVAAIGDDYSKEELVAEMGAAMLCGVAGIENKTIDSSASYIDHWMRQIADDKGLVICAAGKAQKAADYILNESK